MKKILITLILVILFFVVKRDVHAETISQASARLTTNIERTTANPLDVRVKALENVFAKYNSPLFGEASYYVAYADEYGVDWRLLPAISGLESTFGKNLLSGSYNAYGWGGGHIYFESWEDGIRSITKSLRENYMDRGARDVWSIGPIYAASPTWSVRVNRFMQEIEQEYRKLSLFTVVPGA